VIFLDVILSLNDIVKYFGGIRAVDHVNMSFERGKITLIIGPNGSGKTTLINCVSGFYKLDYGKIIYENKDITNMKPHERVKLGLVRTFQIPLPFQKLNVLENLLVGYKDNPGERFILSLMKRKWISHEEMAVKKAFNILKFLELDNVWDRPAYELSGGQLKLVEIGKALMSDPKTLLLDEPAGSVNPVLAEKIFYHILNLKKSLGLTFIIVEHRLDIAVQFADYVYAMDRGKVIAEGDPDKVINDQRVIEAYLG
jgi:branched-chain amino acid transport system ATP-binding protein